MCRRAGASSSKLAQHAEGHGCVNVCGFAPNLGAEVNGDVKGRVLSAREPALCRGEGVVGTNSDLSSEAGCVDGNGVPGAADKEEAGEQERVPAGGDACAEHVLKQLAREAPDWGAHAQRVLERGDEAQIQGVPLTAGRAALLLPDVDSDTPEPEPEPEPVALPTAALLLTAVAFIHRLLAPPVRFWGAPRASADMLRPAQTTTLLAPMALMFGTTNGVYSLLLSAPGTTPVRLSVSSAARSLKLRTCAARLALSAIKL